MAADTITGNWRAHGAKRHAGPHQFNSARWNSAGLIHDEVAR